MKRFSIPIAVGLLLCLTVFGEPASISHTSIDEMPTAKLMELAKKHSARAIKELGRRREMVALPLLRQIASEPDVPVVITGHSHISRREETLRGRAWETNAAHLQAKIALARMGDESSLNNFIVGLSSSNPAWVEKCIGYLGYIGDRRAVRALAPLLYRHDFVPVPGPAGDLGAVPFDVRAANALKMLLPEVENEHQKVTGTRRLMDADDWRKWWEKNKGHFENR